MTDAPALTLFHHIRGNQLIKQIFEKTFSSRYGPCQNKMTSRKEKNQLIVILKLTSFLLSLNVLEALGLNPAIS
ncbi:hypothetical protein ANCDUO_18718 [Ancylostoma duodenale]|uniref:Uncharacterized protein n=1 Tax=Ancylostoma duodenale TaxID=51022 RepID=A0A0C2C4H6_9BILA|nr:hypothetical protein ANCDUO_18718 [Ancylostoma duodenale]